MMRECEGEIEKKKHREEQDEGKRRAREKRT